jgi:hypothetical protein
MPDGGQTQADGRQTWTACSTLRMTRWRDQIIILVDAADHVPAKQ